jgi:YD repeat-containing protein
MDAPKRPWLDDWVTDEALPPPDRWGRPGLLLLFSVECAGCVSRAVPWLRRLAEAHGDDLVLAAVHTAHGRQPRSREQVVEALDRFLGFSRLAVPVALDPSGAWAAATGAEGTPHWFAYDREGRPVRSIFGSQANAMTRLDYLVDELLAA